MSLVAYASSDDDNSNSDNESEEPIQKAAPIETPVNSYVKEISVVDHVDDTKQSDLIEDDEYDVVPSAQFGLSLPPPKHETERPSGPIVNTEGKDMPSVLQGLPAPKPHSKSVFEAEEDELEDEVKPKINQLKDAPVLPAVKKKEKLKISAPILDDDSDEESPAKKKRISSQSGLFGLLPQPKHASVKESGRILVPHNLKNKASAKQSASKQNLPKVPQTVRNDLPIVEDEDSDGEDTGSASFFALNEKMEKKISSSLEGKSEASSTAPALRGPWLIPSAASQGLLGPAKQSVTPVTPSLDHVTKQASIVASTSRAIPGTSEDSANQIGPETNYASDVAGPSDLTGTEMMGPYYGTEEPSMAEENAYPECGDVGSYLQDQEFLKMMGRKKAGKEEINFIDVHGDDQRSEVDLMKHMTEEQDNRSHSRKGKDMPTSRQRNKHQITYLAFQAKERELELKNQWADNRMTRRQTQSKYGF